MAPIEPEAFAPQSANQEQHRPRPRSLPETVSERSDPRFARRLGERESQAPHAADGQQHQQSDGPRIATDVATGWRGNLVHPMEEIRNEASGGSSARFGYRPEAEGYTSRLQRPKMER